MLQLVFACAETRNVKGDLEIAFGLDDGLPWKHISQDFKNFKARTTGTTLVMGARTFQSLPNKLSDRRHIVTHSLGRDVPVNKLGEQADQYVLPERIGFYINHHPEEDYSIIGGAGLLQSFKSIADRIVITKIYKKCYVPSTIKLPVEFVYNIHRGFELSEKHLYRIDDITTIIEHVYDKF